MIVTQMLCRRLLALIVVVWALGAPLVAGQAAPREASSGAIERLSLQADACQGGAAAPGYSCPLPDDVAAQYIEYVRVLGDGIEILLTPAGIELGNECGGAAKLIEMTRDLYDRIPASERPTVEIDWEGRQLEDEVYAHAYFAALPEDATFMGIDFAARGNPINIEFADYTDLESRESGDIVQQLVFRLLGRAKRADCPAAEADG